MTSSVASGSRRPENDWAKAVSNPEANSPYQTLTDLLEVSAQGRPSEVADIVAVATNNNATWKTLVTIPTDGWASAQMSLNVQDEAVSFRATMRTAGGSVIWSASGTSLKKGAGYLLASNNDNHELVPVGNHQMVFSVVGTELVIEISAENGDVGTVSGTYVLGASTPQFIPEFANSLGTLFRRERWFMVSGSTGLVAGDIVDQTWSPNETSTGLSDSWWKITDDTMTVVTAPNASTRRRVDRDSFASGSGAATNEVLVTIPVVDTGMYLVFSAAGTSLLNIKVDLLTEDGTLVETFESDIIRSGRVVELHSGNDPWLPVTDGEQRILGLNVAGRHQVRISTTKASGCTVTVRWHQSNVEEVKKLVSNDLNQSGSELNAAITMQDFSGPGTVQAGALGISAMVIGENDGYINGLVYPPGTGIHWPLTPPVAEGGPVRWPALSYNGTNTVIRIETIRAQELVDAISNVTVNTQDYTSSGTIPAGAIGITALVVGQTDGIINGIQYPPGSGFTWNLVANGSIRYPQLTFDADANSTVIRIQVFTINE